MTNTEISKAAPATPHTSGATINMTLNFAELNYFCTDVNFDNPGSSQAWGILAGGICEAAETQPAETRQMIEQLAASPAVNSRRMAGFAIGPLAVALPTEEREPIMDLWATLLTDESDDVKREAGECLLAMVDDRKLPHEVVSAVFKRMIDAI
jgi:hypothetical protein